MTKKEQLLYLRDQAKKSGDSNLKKLVALGAQASKQSPENQKKIWLKVEQVVKKFKDAEQAAEKAQKASVAKKVASKPKPKAKPKPVAKKAKPTPTPKAKKSSGRGPKSRGETFFGRAKMIREDNPSLTWKEAQAEAKKFFADEKSRKAKAVQDAIKSFPNLKKATKDTTNILKDAAQPAMPPGKRKSRPGAKRKFYWESRSNRSDLRQPAKKYPMLKKGGMIAPSARYLNEYMIATDLDVDQAMRSLEMTLKQGRTHAQIAQDLGFANKLEKGGRFKKGGKTTTMTLLTPGPSRGEFAPPKEVLSGKPFIAVVRDEDDKTHLKFAKTYQGAERMAKQMAKEFSTVAYQVKKYDPQIGATFFDYGFFFTPSKTSMEQGGSLYVTTEMGFPVDEDGFPEDLMVDADVRKMMRSDDDFARKVTNTLLQTSRLSADETQEAVQMFRAIGLDMDYDLGGEPISLGFIKRGRFQKGGRPGDIGYRLATQAEKREFLSDNSLRLLMRGKNSDFAFSEKVVGLVDKYGGMTLTDGKRELVITRKPHKILKQVGRATNKTKAAYESLVQLEKGGRFQKGGKVQKIEPTGKKAPGLILRTDDDVMWFMGTNPKPYGRISCQPLSGYYKAQNTQTFIDEWYNEAIDPQKAVDWQWKSPNSILIQKMKREKVTDFDYEMMPVKSRKFMSANDFATVRSGLLEMGVPKEFAEEATKVIMKGRDLEKGGKVSSSMKRFAQGGSVDADVKSILYDLKKGDRIVLDYTGGMASGQITLEFVSKRRVGKGKTWEKDKWTFKNPNNPKGVKYFAYASDGGVPRFALGNMAISPTAIRKQSK